MIKHVHGGDVYSREIDLDFSANINPLGIPESVKSIGDMAFWQIGFDKDEKERMEKKQKAEKSKK